MDPLTIRSKRREKVNPILACLLLATNNSEKQCGLPDRGRPLNQRAAAAAPSRVESSDRTYYVDSSTRSYMYDISTGRYGTLQRDIVFCVLAPFAHLRRSELSAVAIKPTV